MNQPPDIILVNARRESETEVSVIVEVNGRLQTGLYRRHGDDSDISVLSCVGDDLYPRVEFWRYGNGVFRRLMGAVSSVSRGEKIELPLVLNREEHGS